MSPIDFSLVHMLLDCATKAGATDADAMLIDGDSTDVSWRNGSIDMLDKSHGTTIGLRVLIDGKQAILSSSDLREETLKQMAEDAVEMAKLVPEDPFLGLADPAQLCTKPPHIPMADPDQAPSAEQLLALAEEVGEAGQNAPTIKSSESEASYSKRRSFFAATNGLERKTERTGYSLFSVTMAAEGEMMERDHFGRATVFFDDLPPPDMIGKKAASRARARLGSRQPETGKYPLIFAPRMSRGLISSLLGAINGAAIARGTSFLKDACGEEIFRPDVSIMETPHRARGLASRPMDAEGLPTFERALIDNGRLTTYLLDLRTARKLNLDPTGHAARSVGGQPHPAASNAHLCPGSQSEADMIADINRGIYITELIGQGVNMITGDYSRGAAGFMIENGRITHPVNAFTIAGNLKDMFKNMIPAANLDFSHAINAPSVLIDGMTLSGS